MEGNLIHDLDWSTIAGSGFVMSVLLLALVERLRRTFATRDDLNGLGQKFSALEDLYIQVREATDEARAEIREVRTEQRHQWERINTQVIQPLERITLHLKELSETQAVQTAALKHLDRWLDRVEERHGAPTLFPRRKS